MSQQVKVPSDVKRELELCAAITGRTQGELLASAWREYREKHRGDFREGLEWASAVLADPAQAALEASGVSDEDREALDQALDGPASERPSDRPR